MDSKLYIIYLQSSLNKKISFNQFLLIKFKTKKKIVQVKYTQKINMNKILISLMLHHLDSFNKRFIKEKILRLDFKISNLG